MPQTYEESEVIDIVLDVVNWVDKHDEQFDLAQSEEFVLPWPVEKKARKVVADYGRDENQLSSQGSLSESGLVIESELDDGYVVSILEYLEQNDLSQDDALAGLKMRVNSKGKGGRPSKVEKWAERIENNDATLEDARQDMSDPTWYRLKSRVEE